MDQESIEYFSGHGYCVLIMADEVKIPYMDGFAEYLKEVIEDIKEGMKLWMEECEW